MSKLNRKVMVNATDVERSQLEVALQVVRDFPDIRRADGRKSPHMLCGEEALRLRTEMRAKNQELETLRAQLRLAHDEALAGDEEVRRLSDRLVLRSQRIETMTQLVRAGSKERGNLLRILGDKNDLNFERDQSRWFRLGRWLGFYR